MQSRFDQIGLHCPCATRRKPWGRSGIPCTHLHVCSKWQTGGAMSTGLRGVQQKPIGREHWIWTEEEV